MFDLKILMHAEWKVETCMNLASGPTRFSTLSLISPAALLVKVTARMLYGFTFLSDMRYAILYVSVRVLPEPAPASIKSGPSGAVTAAACIGFNPSVSPIKRSP